MARLWYGHGTAQIIKQMGDRTAVLTSTTHLLIRARDMVEANQLAYDKVHDSSPLRAGYVGHTYHLSECTAEDMAVLGIEWTEHNGGR